MSLALSNLNATPPSALLLSDRLLRLAEDAQSAGCHITAEHLLMLAHTVFDDDECGAGEPRAFTRRRVSSAPPPAMSLRRA